MASTKPCAGQVADRRAAVPTLAGASNAGVLPLDAVHEILLRVPGKELCRLRAVCRLWRSLLSDGAFAAAHAARHPEPLIVAGYAKYTSNGVLYDVLDLSGRVVKRGHALTGGEAENEWVVSARLDLVCVATGAGVSCRLLNPATGAVVRALPQGLADEHAALEQEIGHHTAMVALGKVASTGEHKVLRVLDCFPNAARQLYEIITLDGSGHGRWRRIMDPTFPVGFGTWAVIDPIVYFFSSEFVQGQDAMPDRIASFDLETEEWRRPTIRGPLSSSTLVAMDGVAGAGHPNNHMDWGEFSLAVLDGCVVVTHRKFASSMDLWFLVDEEKGSWVKKHSIQLTISYQHAEHTVRPLVVLNDGRIVLIHIGNRGSLKIYNPRTSTCSDVAGIGPCVAVGLYTGSLLCLANGAF